MGMSASQGRLLSLTARMSDLELRAQVISNAKIRLSQESAQASKAYSEALDKTKLTVFNPENTAYANATVNNLVSYTSEIDLDSTNAKYRFMETSSGALVATSALVNSAFTDSTHTTLKTIDAFLTSNHVTANDISNQTQKYQYYNELYSKISTNNYVQISNQNASDPEWLTNQVAMGNVFLYEFNSVGGDQGTGDFQAVSWETGDNALQMESDDRDIARAEANYERTMADIQTKDKRYDLELKNIDTEHTAIQTEIDSVKKVINKNIERSFKIFDA